MAILATYNVKIIKLEEIITKHTLIILFKTIFNKKYNLNKVIFIFKHMFKDMAHMQDLYIFVRVSNLYKRVPVKNSVFAFIL